MVRAMTHLALVFLGGGVGAVLRFAVVEAAVRAFGPAFPWGTLSVNVVGSMAMGVLAAWLAGKGTSGEAMRVALAVGLLGGFTTFSAFSLDTVRLFNTSGPWPMLGYVAGSLGLAILGLVIGLMAGRALFEGGA